MTETTTYRPLDALEPRQGILVAGGHVLRASGVNFFTNPHEFESAPVNETTMRSALSSVKHSMEQIAHEASLDNITSTTDINNAELSLKVLAGDISEKEVRSKGISIEFAGPTKRMIGLHILPHFKPDHVTNIAREKTGFNNKSEIDALASVSQMPFKARSIGSVHISCLPSGDDYLIYGAPLREEAIQESYRILRTGGFLVWDGGTLKDHNVILSAGFIPRKLLMDAESHKTGEQYESLSYNIAGVYQKAR